MRPYRTANRRFFATQETPRKRAYTALLTFVDTGKVSLHPMEEDIFDFAMVISVAPECESDWNRALRAAKVAPGMTMFVRSSSLAMFVVKAEQEYLAIEKAQAFLEAVAKHAGVRCALNAQPSGEV